LRFDQELVHLTLHAGSSDGGVTVASTRRPHLPAGDPPAARSRQRRVQAHLPRCGFVSPVVTWRFRAQGWTRVDRHLHRWDDRHRGLARRGVPSAGKAVFSVLQNQRLLVDRGVAPASVSDCILTCWGETIGSRTAVARSGLGITGKRAARVGRRRAAPARWTRLAAESAPAPCARSSWTSTRLGCGLPLHPSSGVALPPCRSCPVSSGLPASCSNPTAADFLAFVSN